MKKNITFTLPAQAVGHSEAILLGDFNNWDPGDAPKLKKQEDGSFSTEIKLEEGKTYQYRFLLNDGRWVNDHNAQSYVNVPGMHIDNCVITVPVSSRKEKPETPVNMTTPSKSGKKTSPVKGSSATTEKATAKKASPTPVTKATPVKKAPAKTAAKTASKKATQPAKAARKVAPKKK